MSSLSSSPKSQSRLGLPRCPTFFHYSYRITGSFPVVFSSARAAASRSFGCQNITRRIYATFSGAKNSHRTFYLLPKSPLFTPRPLEMQECQVAVALWDAALKADSNRLFHICPVPLGTQSWVIFSLPPEPSVCGQSPSTTKV